MSTSSRELRADCALCCGLCCVAPAFDAAQGFGYDKPAHQPCRHLDAFGRCDIHPVRAREGFPACAGFDCFGAGQWVTQRLYGGRSWRDRSVHAAAMFDAYRRFRALHRMQAAIRLAHDHDAGADRCALEVLERRVERACDEEASAPGSVPVDRLQAEIFRALRARLARD